MQRLKLVISTIFFLFIVLLVLRSKHPPVQSPHPLLLQELLKGSDRGYIPLGHEFSKFKNILPEAGTFSFIFDYPFGAYAPNVEWLYTAQNQLAPLILNPQPVEPAALVYCTNSSIADKRMRETGYRLAAVIGDGKAIAVKTR